MKDKTTINSLFTANMGTGPNKERERVPCIEILYHYDLERIGLVATPKEFTSTRARELMFGRGQPDFWPVTLSASLNPEKVGIGLEDPCISRHHFTLTWSGEEYEIVPIPGKRPLKLWPLRPEVQPGVHAGYGPPFELDRPTRAAPGSLLAIGDRVLMLLDHRPMRDPRADRMGIIGESAAMWQVRDEIAAVARLQRPVWLHGETGVGKELVARAIHAQSSRREAPMRVINCGAIPETLVESVFFGHRKGAFTGANAASPGMFRNADQGTLLLDEIGELPTDMQQKLLRVLQNGTIMPVGAARELEVDVRVIAATWRDLEAEVQKGRFRADLFYRLSVHVVRIPALRHRRVDIPRLFTFFLQKRREEYRELERLFRSVEPTLAPIPMDFFLQLISDDWSGNVRQLENVVEKLVQFNLHDGPFEPPTWQTSKAATGSATLPPASQLPPRPSLAAPPHTPAPSIPNPHNLASAGMQPSHPAFTPGGAWASQSHSAVPTPAATAPPISAEDRSELVDQVLHQIGLTPPTAIKLMGNDAYQHLCLQFDPVSGPDTLKGVLTDSLQAWLERYDYNQTHTAKALGVSRMTLIRAMGNLGFVRPKELKRGTIEAALTHSGGDVQLAARRLRVSSRGLQRRINSLGIDS